MSKQNDDKELREELLGMKPKKIDHKKVTKVSWVPYAVSVLVYFISKVVAEAAGIPIDMYAFVIIIAGLLTYNHYIYNK